VYKLVALWQEGAWTPAIKLSETPIKVPNPGDKRVWRVYDDRGRATADLLSLRQEEPAKADPLVLRHPTEETTYRLLARQDISEMEPLLVEVWREGVPAHDTPSIQEMRARRQADLERLDPGVRRIVNPHRYHVSLSERLWTLKQDLIASFAGPGP
jgi:nicotinate phosphoribosyltransferase